MLTSCSRIKIAGLTDAGLSRDHNEDFIGFDENIGVAVLADGMGGHQAGEVASQMAVESVLTRMRKLSRSQHCQSLSDRQLLNFVTKTIRFSNKLIYEESERSVERNGMGTTLVAATVLGSRFYAGHVGDSRIYLYRNQRLRRITKDHSLIQDLIDKGFYTEEEARNANVGHIVTRALGATDNVKVDTIRFTLKRNDLLLICSDGLTDMLTNDMIENTLAKNAANLNLTAQKLVDQANEMGGKDNISVILMQAAEIQERINKSKAA